MRIQFLCLFNILMICSCAKKETTVKLFDGKNDIQFNFAQTTDRHFCNPDSIIPSDCSGGDFYFSKKGNVFYTFFCMGGDSVSYSIGKYMITDSLVTCIFNQGYSFYNGEYGHSPDGKSIDPNSGKLRDTKSITVKLKKVSCDTIKYYFTTDRNEIFVLRKPWIGNGSIDFISEIKKVKIFSDM
jgi:hypothetical protein